MKTLHFSTFNHARWGGRKRYIRVFIHDSPEELQQAAARYRRTPIMEWKDSIGCFHPIWIHKKYVNGKWKGMNTSSFAGVIRFNKEDVNANVMTHEIIHVAAAIYRMDVRKICNLGTDCFEAEEIFAYLVGDLTASLSIQLHNADAWTKDIVQ